MACSILLLSLRAQKISLVGHELRNIVALCIYWIDDMISHSESESVNCVQKMAEAGVYLRICNLLHHCSKGFRAVTGDSEHSPLRAPITDLSLPMSILRRMMVFQR